MPYILLILLVIAGASYLKTRSINSQVVELGNQNQDLLIQVKDLSEQNKHLSEQNKQIGEEGKAFTKCVADAFLLYINTGSPVNLKDDNLDACVLEQVARNGGNSATPSSSPTPSQSPSTPPASQKPADPSKQPEQTNTPPDPRNQAQHIIDYLQTVPKMVDNLIKRIPGVN